MRDTLLVSSTGHTATLGALSTIIEAPGQTEIRRQNLQRYVAVTARLEGTNLGSGMAAVQKTVSGLHLPSSIRVEYGGTYQEQQRSFHDLVIVLVLAVLLLFIVLMFEFGTFSAPVAILSSALLSTSGVFIALLITRTTFNISSFMGMIMVIGIVAKNGILLLDADQRMRALGASPQDAILQAGHRYDRLGYGRRHAAPGLRHRRGISNAAAPSHCGYRWGPDFDGAFTHHHSSCAFLPG